jgi:hypothetical protein
VDVNRYIEVHKMATLESAKAKWARKMADAGPKWYDGVKDKGDDYCKGMADFLGTTPDYCMRTKSDLYTKGVDAVGASGFGAAVSGKEEKWAKKLKEAFTPK